MPPLVPQSTCSMPELRKTRARSSFLEVRVPTIDDGVAWLEQARQFGDHLVSRRTGGNHNPHTAWLGELPNQFGHRPRNFGAGFTGKSARNFPVSRVD